MKFLEEWDRQLTRLREDQFYFWGLVLMTIVVAALVFEIALGLHGNFWSVACDTAALQSAIVNTLHGNWFRDTAYDGPNLLGLHTMLVLLLVVPIYGMFPSPNTLFALQVIGVYSTVIPLYLVALEVLRRRLTAFLVAALALVSPFLFPMAVATFHPEGWILAAVFWSYYFYRKNNVLGFWMSLGFAVSCGEQAALIYLAMGLGWLLFEDGVAWRKKYGVFALAGGVGWLIIALGVITPAMRHPGQHNLFGYNYSDWGVKSASGLLTAVMQDPLKASGMLFDSIRWLYVASLVGFPLVLAFFSFRSLILLVPAPVYFLMTDQEFFLFFHTYYFQFAFFAGYMGLLFFLGRQEITTRLGAMILTTVVFLNVLLLCYVAAVYIQPDVEDASFNTALRETFAQIPPDAGVYSPHRFSAYLSNRENMVLGDLSDENFDFKAMLDADFVTSDVHPEQIDYIVSDLRNDQCGPRKNGFDPTTAKRRAENINNLLKNGGWQIVWNQNDVVILKRVGK